eukprot:COSAG05_NODE_4148_length_1652_cov_1.618802_1_plen_342_part_01
MANAFDYSNDHHYFTDRQETYTAAEESVRRRIDEREKREEEKREKEVKKRREKREKREKKEKKKSEKREKKKAARMERSSSVQAQAAKDWAAENWAVLEGGRATLIVLSTSANFEIELRPGLTLLELYEAAAGRAGVAAQCVQLCFAGSQELLPALESVAVAKQLVSATGVHEGSELIVSTLQLATEGTVEGALGLPATVVAQSAAHAGAVAVAELRRWRLGLELDAPEEAVALALSGGEINVLVEEGGAGFKTNSDLSVKTVVLNGVCADAGVKVGMWLTKFQANKVIQPLGPHIVLLDNAIKQSPKPWQFTFSLHPSGGALVPPLISPEREGMEAVGKAD